MPLIEAPQVPEVGASFEIRLDSSQGYTVSPPNRIYAQFPPEGGTLSQRQSGTGTSLSVSCKQFGKPTEHPQVSGSSPSY